jgi:hypothetical protein
MMWEVALIAAGAGVALLLHEVGHWLASGRALRFRREGVRWVWTMPEGIDDRHRAWIAKSGFGAQWLGAMAGVIWLRFVPALGLWCFLTGFLGLAAAEWWCYPTSSAANDFNYMDSDDVGKEGTD